METDFIKPDRLVKCVAKSLLLGEDNLYRLSAKLDNGDAVSLLFLMCNYGSAKPLYEKLCKTAAYSDNSSRISFAELCLNLIEDWQNKLIEALVELELFQYLLEIFRVNKYDALFNVNCGDKTLNYNRVRLYRICDGMTKEEERTFLANMIDIVGASNTPVREFCYLELYFLYWETLDIINPSTGKGLNDVVACLRQLESPLIGILLPESSQTDDDYTLRSYPILNENEVGLCIIVNQWDFSDSDNNRESSVNDEKALTNALESLKFKCIAKHNLLSTEMEVTIKDTINANFDDTHSIFILTVMSHGRDGQIMGREGMYVSTKLLLQSLYEIKKLNKIPKILLVCACRGDKLFTSRQASHYEADGSTASSIRSDIMDIIICYSTIPGFISIRNKLKGSLFMQVLCEILERRSDLEICEIFTLVNNALMNPKDFRSFNPAKIANPCEFQSRLLKKLYLKKHPKVDPLTT